MVSQLPTGKIHRTVVNRTQKAQSEAEPASLLSDGQRAEMANTLVGANSNAANSRLGRQNDAIDFPFARTNLRRRTDVGASIGC
jgi:hypothetical protein